MPIKLITLLLSILMLPNNVFATETPHKIIGEVIEYKDGDTVLEGYYVPSRCGDLKETYPTVMVIHQWKGLTDNERMRAEMLSRQCYNAFAIDMYKAFAQQQTKMPRRSQGNIRRTLILP